MCQLCAALLLVLLVHDIRMAASHQLRRANNSVMESVPHTYRFPNHMLCLQTASHKRRHRCGLLKWDAGNANAMSRLAE